MRPVPLGFCKGILNLLNIGFDFAENPSFYQTKVNAVDDFFPHIYNLFSADLF